MHKTLIDTDENGAYSDLTITCGDMEFQVHKCIVCPQSRFFRKVCEKQKWKEGLTGVVALKAIEGDCPDLGDDDPNAVKLMIDYLYLGDYDPSSEMASGSSTPAERGNGCESIAHATAMVQTAGSHHEESVEQFWVTQAAESAAHDVGPARSEDDTWALPIKKTKKDCKKGKKLKMPSPPPEPEPELEPSPPLPVATSARSNANSSFMEMHAKVFAIASKYEIKPLERIARQKLKDQTKRNWNIADLTAAMEIVFGQTPEGEVKLRCILKDVIVEHALTLVQYPGFEDAVARIDGLAYDLFCRKTYSVG